MAPHGVVDEVTISLAEGCVIEWNLPTGNPPRHGESFPPVLIFVADDVQLALRQHKTCWPNGGTLNVDQAGFANCTQPGSGSVIYELFPVRFDDERPYEPLCYVGRWPD